MLRIYTLAGCKYCGELKTLLSEKQISYEEIQPEDDGIIATGLAVVFPGRPPMYPISVALGKNAIHIGFERGEYEQFLRTYGIDISTGVSDGSAVEQQPVGETANLVEAAAS